MGDKINIRDCPLMFWHEWITRPWPEETHPHCQWCGQLKPTP